MCSELERRQAIIDLLSIPNSPDLHRGNRLKLEGRADRYHLVPNLAAAFVQSKLLEMRVESLNEYAIDSWVVSHGRKEDRPQLLGNGFHERPHRFSSRDLGIACASPAASAR